MGEAAMVVAAKGGRAAVVAVLVVEAALRVSLHVWWARPPPGRCQRALRMARASAPCGRPQPVRAPCAPPWLGPYPEMYPLRAQVSVIPR